MYLWLGNLRIHGGGTCSSSGGVAKALLVVPQSSRCLHLSSEQLLMIVLQQLVFPLLFLYLFNGHHSTSFGL